MAVSAVGEGAAQVVPIKIDEGLFLFPNGKRYRVYVVDTEGNKERYQGSEQDLAFVAEKVQAMMTYVKPLEEYGDFKKLSFRDDSILLDGHKVDFGDKDLEAYAKIYHEMMKRFLEKPGVILEEEDKVKPEEKREHVVLEEEIPEPKRPPVVLEEEIPELKRPPVVLEEEDDDEEPLLEGDGCRRGFANYNFRDSLPPFLRNIFY